MIKRIFNKVTDCIEDNIHFYELIGINPLFVYVATVLLGIGALIFGIRIMR